MKERPILFSGSMVRALLAGTKTQTRRTSKLDLINENPQRWNDVRCFDGEWSFRQTKPDNGRVIAEEMICCPYGQPGERLWVRESLRFEAGFLDDAALRYADGACRSIGPNSGAVPDSGLVIYFRLLDKAKAGKRIIGVPSIHMPRWASRINLEITDVRVEQLNKISAADAQAEGIAGIALEDIPKDGTGRVLLDPVAGYRSLWEEINGAGSWDLNPWVWVVGFKRVMA